MAENGYPARNGSQKPELEVWRRGLVPSPAGEPVVEDPAVRTEQHQVRCLAAGQPADLLADLEVAAGARVLPADGLRDGFGALCGVRLGVAADEPDRSFLLEEELPCWSH